MTQIEQQVRSAQRRLWMNRWLRCIGWAMVIATSTWMAGWIADRLLLLEWPMHWVAAGLSGAALLGSIIWFSMTREAATHAAETLDTAAGLKERIGTSLHFTASDDPFARAANADAEKRVTGLTARSFIPVRWTRSLSWSTALVAVALLSLLLPEWDILGKRKKKNEALAREAAVKQVKLATAKSAEAIKHVVEKIPELQQSAEYKELQAGLKGPEKAPDELRREAIRKLDKMSERLKKEAAAERFKALEETKKQMAKAIDSENMKSEMGRMMEALANGNAKEAKDELRKAQESLAKRTKEGKVDPQKSKEMQQQLDNLAKKLEQQQQQQQQQNQQQLQNQGMSKEEAKKTLEALAKADKKQLEQMAKELAERMKEKGMTEQQAKEMLEKLQQKQEASGQCEKMGENMSKAGEKMSQGEMEAAAEALEKIGEQLSDMEQLEQTLNDLESQMSELQEARDELSEQEGDEGGEQSGDKQSGECKECNGSGHRKDGAPCPDCEGTGQGGKSKKKGKGKDGGRGAGKGGSKAGSGTYGEDEEVDPNDPDRLNAEKATSVTKRASGAIDPTGRSIGQQFLKGRQIKGRTEAEIMDAATAAELDATDALNRDRVTRNYRNSVKSYFDRLPESMKAQPAKTNGAAKDEAKSDKSDDASSVEKKEANQPAD